MPQSYSTFEGLKNKGLEAYKGGDYSAATTYLADAAGLLIEMAEKARNSNARRQHEELAAELIDLAKECDRLHAGGGRALTHSPAGVRGGRGGSPGASGDVRGRRRQLQRADDNESDAEEWIIRDKPAIGFDDIAGLEDVKQEIRVKMIYPFTHPELAGRYGIPVGGGVLLFGPPGTGKTMMAKAIAHEIEATYFVVSPAEIMSKWVGEAEQNVRKLFEAAKAEDKSVIFLDEIDALVPKRKGDTSTVMQRVVPQILQELEGFDRTANRALLLVGATNKPWMLDEAMLRPGRMDAKVYLGLPDAPARFKLLEIYFGDKPLSEDIDFGELCDRLEGHSGADIKSIAARAAQIPFLEAVGGKEPRPINRADVMSVIEETPPSVNKADLGRYDQFREGWK
jgi:transitional endoplasmic reticulum ATPase